MIADFMTVATAVVALVVFFTMKPPDPPAMP